ncbi:MAG TPA: gliding motility protein GldB [Prevotella sp.]|nr:gliding motility protein GldB [Prevotella sp.]
MKKIYGLLFLSMVLCMACEFKFKPNENDDQNTPIEVKRYDRLESRYLTTGDFSALQEMNTEYPLETRTLIEKVLQIGTVDDPEISTKFLRFYQDSTLQSLITNCETEYANMDDINQQLNDAFDQLQKWLPDLPRPMVYTQITSLDQSIIIGEKTIGISLDKYMGENYPLYKKYYTYEQMKTMTRKYIVPDCLSFYLLSLYPMENFDSRPQLEKDLHMAKVLWVVNEAMGIQFFKSKYTALVSRYMHRHPATTIAQLLTLDDYHDFT